MSTAELACSYAALILADEDVNVTVRCSDHSQAHNSAPIRPLLTSAREQAEKLQSILKAAKIEEVEPIWTSLFAKVSASTPGNCLRLTHILT